MRLTLFLPLLSLPLLTACGDGTVGEDDGASAAGEVLQGTISDEMLPLATVRSQPPLLPPEQQDGGDETGTEAGEPAAAPASGEDAETPAAPAATAPSSEGAAPSEE